MLTNEQIELIQDSFAQVVPISDPVARLFYDRLFEMRPDFRTLFPDDMDEQRSKLVVTLAAVVQSLNDIEKIIDDVKALGERHVGYGTAPEDYDSVGAALIWTLRNSIKQGWTDAHENAWIAAYELVAETMLEGAANLRVA